MSQVLGCTVSFDRDDIGQTPLFLMPGTTEIYPTIVQTTDVKFHQGEQVELSCTGGFKYFKKQKTILATCDGGVGFTVNGDLYKISELTCQSPSFHEAQRTNRTCFENATLIEVGYPVKSGFLKMYEACFDEESYVSVYSRYRMAPWNVKTQKVRKRPQFISNGFYDGLNVNKKYSFVEQRNTLIKILKTAERVDALLNQNKDLFLARGHLAAKAEFVYVAHQLATFWFMNVAPQWQSFNGKNWQRIESNLRDYLARKKISVTVYTGTYGVLELADTNGDPQKLYLDYDADGVARIPVPKIYYKVLHDEANDAGIALIGVNNPFITKEELKEDFFFCEDVADQLDWWKFDRLNLREGFCYACRVDEFNAVTKHLPLQPIANLLL
ncbi:uncharacterized protein LOC129743543 [Uranotaenia lowii]|uniref:uncharacterized protein LOC129743543 n=1 Tax=Uranotaenia lowii TaxID=190385 RepID=UPI0024790856|nr:uncharacterized protein LOC129743543 [Uranotaenia lowii]